LQAELATLLLTEGAGHPFLHQKEDDGLCESKVKFNQNATAAKSQDIKSFGTGCGMHC